MRKVSFNDFRKLGIELEIGNRVYTVHSIPYPIESDIYANLTTLDGIFRDVSLLNDEWKERINYWIWETISFDKNENKDIKKDELFNNLGITDRIGVMTLIIKLITDRMFEMQNMFTQKKTD